MFFALHHKDCILLRILVRLLQEFKRPKARQWTLTESKDFAEIPAKLLCAHAGIPAVGIDIPVCSGKKGGQKTPTQQNKKNHTREEV